MGWLKAKAKGKRPPKFPGTSLGQREQPAGMKCSTFSPGCVLSRLDFLGEVLFLSQTPARRQGNAKKKCGSALHQQPNASPRIPSSSFRCISWGARKKKLRLPGVLLTDFACAFVESQPLGMVLDLVGWIGSKSGPRGPKHTSHQFAPPFPV